MKTERCKVKQSARRCKTASHPTKASVPLLLLPVAAVSYFALSFGCAGVIWYFRQMKTLLNPQQPFDFMQNTQYSHSE
jgi:hypothetical protein